MRYFKQLSFQSGPASPKTTIIVMSAVAILALAFSAFTFFHAKTLDATGQRVEGRIVDIVNFGDGMKSAVYQFIDVNGQQYIVRSPHKSKRPRYNIGDTVQLIYAPSHPDKAVRDGWGSLYIAPVALALMSIGFFLGSLLIKRYERHFQSQYEAQYGRMTVIVEDNNGVVSRSEHSSAPLVHWSGYLVTVFGVTYFGFGIWTGVENLTNESLASGWVGSIAVIIIGSLFVLLGTGLIRHAKKLKLMDIKPSDQGSDRNEG